MMDALPISEKLAVPPPIELRHQDSTASQKVRSSSVDAGLGSSAGSGTEPVKPSVDQLNKALRDAGATELKVELLDSGEGPVFHIVDKKTGKHLLQIPSEYQLSIERTVEMIRGALFDAQI